jgi:hypothetical protein
MHRNATRAWAGLAVVAWLAVAAASQAQAPAAGKLKLTVTVPKEGEHFIRFLTSPDAKQPVQLPIRFLDKRTTVNVSLDDIGRKASVAIDNARTGDTAIRPLHGPRAPLGGEIDLKQADFDHVRQVDVSVSYGDKPVASARVTLTPAGSKPVVRLIDASKRGVASFEDVPMGRAKVEVLYGDKLTQTQDIDIVGDRPAAVLTVKVTVASSVPVVEGDRADTAAAATSEPAPQGAADRPAPPPPTPGSNVAGLIGNLLGLAIAAAAIYALYRWARSGGMAATLNKAGIEVSGPAADPTPTPWSPAAAPPPVVADPTLCQFCGEKKDGAGRCACSALPTGATAHAQAVASPSQPRLVGSAGVYAGTVFALGPGMTIGRDAGHGIALPDDTTVSRRHASITDQNGEVAITDEGSSNGVYVNGVRISSARALRAGDEVQIGNTRFRYEV